jgi:hypothetical protein
MITKEQMERILRSYTTVFGELSVAQNQVQTGWNFPYNLNTTKIRQITANGGSISHSGNFAVVSTGTDAAGKAEVRTEGQIAYTPGIGALCRFTAIFDDPVADCTQIIGVGDDDNGFFFGYDGLNFGVLRRARGVDTWTYQEDWNIDRHTTINPQIGNVYQIGFKWLGFGDQYFSIAKGTGDVELVHQIKYANRNSETSVDIPSLPMMMSVTNTGNTTDVSMRSPSAVAFSEGEAFPIAFTTPIGYEYSEAVSTGANYLFSILNPPTYLTKDNKLYLEPALFTFANDTIKPLTIRIIFNATLTTPSWVDIDTGKTPAQADTAAAAFTGGTEIISATLGRESGLVLDLTSILSGEKLWADSTITFVADAQANGDTTSSLTFRSRV